LIVPAVLLAAKWISLWWLLAAHDKQLHRVDEPAQGSIWVFHYNLVYEEALIIILISLVIWKRTKKIKG
jgi:hypothetical protein